MPPSGFHKDSRGDRRRALCGFSVVRRVDFPTPNLASIYCLGPILGSAAHLSQVIPDSNTDKAKAPSVIMLDPRP